PRRDVPGRGRLRFHRTLTSVPNAFAATTERVKMRTLLVVLPVLLAGTAVHAQAPAVSGPADLMPVPAEVVWQKGQLPLDAKMTVATAGPADPRVQAALERALVRLRALGVATARAPRAGPCTCRRL